MNDCDVWRYRKWMADPKQLGKKQRSKVSIGPIGNPTI